MRLNLLARCLAGLLATIAVTFVTPNLSARDDHPPHLVGTYTNMHYVAESGDVQGYELKIVYGGTTVQGALQIARGVPSGLMLVEIKQIQNGVVFTIPGKGPYSGKFNGTADGSTITGQIHFNDGRTESVTLPRAQSYWDNPDGY